MKTLALHFDSVIHSYVQHFGDATVIPDTPVPGAFDFIRRASEKFDLVVLSPRAGYKGGEKAMLEWMQFWAPRAGLKGDPAIIDRIKFYAIPPVWATLDPRAVTFRGAYPKIEDLLRMGTWNR